MYRVMTWVAGGEMVEDARTDSLAAAWAWAETLRAGGAFATVVGSSTY